MADDLSPEEQQERWLEEGKAVTKQQAFLMKRALDNGNLRDGLKYASNMLCEMRTGLLSPKNFYELYIMVRCWLNS
jgi:vacuolar protein sorting-associated protein 35